MDLQNDYKVLYQLTEGNPIKATKEVLPIVTDQPVKYVIADGSELDAADIKAVYGLDGRLFATFKSDASRVVEIAVYSAKNERLLGRLDADVMEDYLWFAGEGGTLNIRFTSSELAEHTNIQTSMDKENWTSVQSGDAYPITLQKRFFRNTTDTLSTFNHGALYMRVAKGKNVRVGGRLASMINNKPASAHCFKDLFGDDTVRSEGLVDAKKLLLPDAAAPDAEAFASHMFNDCVDLVVPPETLPLMTLTPSCYYGMFSDCRALTSYPKLPATTLAENCYKGMFHDCIGLRSLPVLPAVTLAPGCYAAMFRYCSSIVDASSFELPAEDLAKECYANMFDKCAGLVKAPQSLPATALMESCYYEMFSECSVLTTAPIIAAENLDDSSCEGMFNQCSHLKISQGSGSKAFFTCPDTTGLDAPVTDMFKDTGGSFTSDPTTGNKYYYN